MRGLIDTHFHLDMYRNYEEVFHYLEKEKQYTLCMTNSPGVFMSCKDLFPDSKYVQFALGFHPLNDELKLNDIKTFRHLLNSTNYVGEIGLDFSKKKGLERKYQIEYFDEIVSLCAENNKLMSVHIRSAEKEALQIIDKYKPLKCIIHWYSGALNLLYEFSKLNCFFSINANMLKNIDIIRNIPQNQLLIESDGPYTKIDGKKYKPQFLMREYELIAKALDDPDLIQQVYLNFKRLLIMK